jgi:antitoxin (DNA-binding transcriptional repressor) of toxin-antitoxin stability system
MATLPKSLPPSPVKLAAKKIEIQRSISSHRSASVAALLKDVEQNREEVTLLRRGVPIARIVPIAEAGPQSGYGWMRGSVRELGDIVGPTGEEWDAGNE